MLESNHKKLLRIGTHTLVWVVLFCLPYLLAAGETFNLQRLLKHSTVPLLYYAIIFYANYIILIDKFLFTPQKWSFFIFNFILIACMVFLSQYIKSLYFPSHVRADDPRPPFQFFVYIDMLSMMIPLLFSIGLRTYERWIKSEAEHQQASNEKLISELQHLKYQLQPHFFFNSLNNIYSLIDQHPDRAKETVHSLAKLMRYLLYDTNAETISLAKEIDFMKKYIALMELRTSEQTKIIASFPEVNPQVVVAPLLFISLIENAFKHGVSATEPSNIKFDMHCDEREIVFTCSNLYIPNNQSDKSGSGIGLENLQKRLALLYPQAHELRSEIAEGYYLSYLSIQFQPSKK